MNSVIKPQKVFFESQELKQLINSLYQQAQQLPQKLFDHWIVSAVKQVIDFDSCFWGDINQQEGWHFCHNLNKVEKEAMQFDVGAFDRDLMLGRMMGFQLQMNGNTRSGAAGLFELTEKSYFMLLSRDDSTDRFTAYELSQLHFIAPHIVQSHFLTQFIGNHQIWLNKKQCSLQAIYKQLSFRRKTLCSALLKGKTDKQIGKLLNISHFTVSNHLKEIYRLFEVNNRTQVIALLQQIGVAGYE